MATPAWKPVDDSTSAWKPVAEAAPNDHAIREHLQNEGFLDSAWNVIKSPFSMIASMVNGDAGKDHAADMQRAKELEANGTTEQRREFAKEYLLKAIPGASTVYKAVQGNIPGALGDVAGMGVLGGAAKVASKVPEVVRVATNPEVARAALEVIPKGPAIGKLIDKMKSVRDASVAAPEAAPAAAATPGELLARQHGQDWAKLSPDERGIMESVARGQQNAAAQPPRPPMGPPAAPAAAAEPAAPSPTIAEQLQAEFGRKEAAPVEAAPPAPAPKGKRQAPAPLPAAPGTAQRVPTPMGTTGTPLGTMPDLSRMTRPQIIEATGLPPNATEAQIAHAINNPPPPAEVPPVASPSPAPPVQTAAPAPPAPRTLAQTEAAMMQKAPAPIENTRTRTNADGSTMSPQMRGATRTAANVAAKAQRFADAFHAEGITAEDAGNMSASDWRIMTDGLVQKGVLKPGEMPPSQSAPAIIKNLKALEKANGAAKAPAKVTPISGPMARNPKAAEIAAKLADMMREN